MRLSDLGASITIPTSMIDAATDRIVASATPQVVAIIQQEKAIIESAGFKSMPFFGGSVAVFLGTLFLVPGDRTLIKVLGYLISAGLLGGGVLMFLSAFNATAATPPAANAAVNQPSSYKIDFSL